MTKDEKIDILQMIAEKYLFESATADMLDNMAKDIEEYLKNIEKEGSNITIEFEESTKRLHINFDDDRFWIGSEGETL